MFMRSKFAGDKAAANHNEWTFILFVEWLLVDISKKMGKPVQSSTIESYVSLLKGYLLFSYDFETPAQSPRLSRLIALVRSEDPLAGIRSKRHGFRRRHLRALWKQGGPLCGAGAVSLCHALVQRRSKVKHPRFACLQHEGLARGGARLIQVQERFLGEVLVKWVILM